MGCGSYAFGWSLDFSKEVEVVTCIDTRENELKRKR